MSAFLVAGLAMSASGSVHAGAPTLMRGAVQIIGSGAFTVGARSARADGARGKFRKDELEVLAEYGLTDSVTILFSPRLTAQAAGRFARVSTIQDVTLTRSGPQLDLGGAARLGARARLWRGQRDVLSLELSGRGGAIARDVTRPVMSRAAEVEARLLWQRQFDLMGRPWFVDLQAGYRHFFESSRRDAAAGSAGEIVLDATLGVHATPRLMLLLQNFSTFDQGSRSDGAGSAHKLQISAAWKLTPLWTVQAGVIGTYAGSGAWRERGVVIGVWRSFGGR